ncbi:DUF2612 domain-containing protein [Chitinasiproducens palmae]|uniref:DUF2612 domain-containing protein n=1 Tax=Chitinasiproducens palmae TaxID=1770053 RepID=A0A1H2PQK4_9BURK|nr:DUF2612 domain-containing protein [Chitinasiproducens palmae]SDV49070.1 Protein of unknown function [Chitinasiproducens palmae]
MADASEYTNLITSEHADKPRFSAVVAALCTPLMDARQALLDVRDAFDLEIAKGAQLDAIGAWAGIERRLSTPLQGVYFALDDPVIGLDQGVWIGPYDPSAGIVSLEDDEYRIVIRAKIGANAWDGTLPDAIRVLDVVFNNDGRAYARPVVTDAGDPVVASHGGSNRQLVIGVDHGTYVMIEDHDDMSVSFVMSGNIPSPVVQALLSSGRIALKPEAVSVNGYYRTSLQGGPVFGFDAQNQYIAGFDVGAWPEKLVGAP